MKQREVVKGFVALWLSLQTFVSFVYTLAFYDRRERAHGQIQAPVVSAPPPGPWRVPTLDIENSTSIDNVVADLLSDPPPATDLPPFGNSVRVGNDQIVNRAWRDGVTRRAGMSSSTSAALW